MTNSSWTLFSLLGHDMPIFCLWWTLLGTATLVWAYWRSKPIEYWKLALLLVLPLMWTIVGVLGGYFWLDWARKPLIRNPDWVVYLVSDGIFVYLGCAIGLIVYLRGVRVFASLFALFNLPFMLYMSFIGGMAVTGIWL